MHIFIFTSFAQNKPSDGKFTVSLGTDLGTNQYFCYHDPKLNHMGVVLQAAERAILLTPRVVENTRIEAVHIWLPDQITQLISATNKQLKNQWHRPIIKRIQFLMQRLTNRNQSITFRTFQEQDFNLDPPTDFPSPPPMANSDPLVYAPFARKAWLVAKSLGRIDMSENATPLLFADRYALVDKEKTNGTLGQKPK